MVQTEHTEKKKLYESAKSAHESKLAKLDDEVAGYKDELAAAESKYHQVNCQLKLVDVNIRRVTQVLAWQLRHFFRSAVVYACSVLSEQGGESLNLRDEYQRRVKQAEEENQDLKASLKSFHGLRTLDPTDSCMSQVRQKHLKDSAAPSQEQIAMLRDLKTLMEMKMQVS